ncbi:hypothetical protein AJ80_02674 [Polytolypa hystricis UAMH7299]|uniref:G domain-containing protein n=1 Tax=Polytolypa hystricis (strain UAMH7299) TaxID=1447883 RepID=A0A2B7YQU5_POLH7|nr:hypothetical protein AJ80_02674 [Polytolypa hystricis UAMH7299]
MELNPSHSVGSHLTNSDNKSPPLLSTEPQTRRSSSAPYFSRRSPSPVFSFSSSSHIVFTPSSSSETASQSESCSAVSTPTHYRHQPRILPSPGIRPRTLSPSPRNISLPPSTSSVVSSNLELPTAEFTFSDPCRAAFDVNSRPSPRGTQNSSSQESSYSQSASRASSSLTNPQTSSQGSRPSAHAAAESTAPTPATTPESPRISPDAEAITVLDLYNATPNRSDGLPRGVRSLRTSTFTLSENSNSLVNGIDGLELNRGPDPSGLSSVAGDLNEMDIDDHGEEEQDPAPYTYSARNEPLPRDQPYYNASFQSKLRDGINIARTIRNVLHGSELASERGSGLNNILRTATELSEYNAPTTRTVALVGNSGQGKSSLINSLLDEVELAKTGSEGAAVTSFVTEYRYSLEHHTSNYVVEVEYLQGDELDKELTQLLDDSRQPYAPAFRENCSADAFQEAEEKSKIANTALSSAFGHQPDWDLDQLRGFGPFSLVVALSNLRRWAKLLEWPDGARDGTWTDSAETSQNCRESTERFMQHSLWPFVKVVRMYLKAAVLKPGLILADLPGFRDINLARVQAARRYLSTCNEIFIVSDIKRATTDETIEETIREHLESSGEIGRTATPGLAIICSHAAVFDDSNLEHRWRSHIDQGQLRRIKKEMKSAKKGEWTNMTLYRKAKIRYDKLFVAARNSKVRGEMKSKYFNVNPKVFCIDNKRYREPANFEEVEMSGIPGLRTFCYTIPAEALYASANNFLQNSLPSLVRSLQLWHDSGMEDGSQPLLQLVSTTALREVSKLCNRENGIDLLERDLPKNLRSHYKDTILRSFRNGKRTINANAINSCLKWRSLHHSTYMACCRRNGTYHSPTAGYMCWNTDLIECMNTFTETPWDTLDDKSEDEFIGLEAGLSSFLHGIYELAQVNVSYVDANAPRPFLRNIQSRQRIIQQVIEEAAESYMTSKVKRDAAGGHATSFIREQMIPAYQHCARDSGGGVIARSQSHMLDHLRNEDIFNLICKNAKRLLNGELTDIVSFIHNQIEVICNDIDNDLASILTADVSLREKYPDFFESLNRVLEWAGTAVGQWEEAGFRTPPY